MIKFYSEGLLFVPENLNIWFVTWGHPAWPDPSITLWVKRSSLYQSPPLILSSLFVTTQRTPGSCLTLIFIWISDKHKALSLMFLNKGKNIWIIFTFRIVHWDKMLFHFSIRYSQLYHLESLSSALYCKCLFTFTLKYFLDLKKSSIKVKKTMFGMF